MKINIKSAKVGSLHTALGVKQGNKIPASKLKIKSTDSPALKKKKQFAINAKKWKHDDGGFISGVQGAANAIPGYGQAISTAIGIGEGTDKLGQSIIGPVGTDKKKLMESQMWSGMSMGVLGIPEMINAQKQYKEAVRQGNINNLMSKPIVQQPVNPYGIFMDGGSISANDFNKNRFWEYIYGNGGRMKYQDGGNLSQLMNNNLIQYNGPSHEDGGIMVDQNGLPTNGQSQNEVEGNETNKDGYIFSDTLGVDKDGIPTHIEKNVKKTFAQLSKKIEKKYGDRNDLISENTKKVEYSQLKQMNENALQNKDASNFATLQKKMGGLLNKYEFNDANKYRFWEGMYKNGGEIGSANDFNKNRFWEYMYPNGGQIDTNETDEQMDQNKQLFYQAMGNPTFYQNSNNSNPINFNWTNSSNNLQFNPNTTSLLNYVPKPDSPSFDFSTARQVDQINSTNPSNPFNKLDYLGTGLSLLPLAQSIAAITSKSHNYLGHPDYSILNDINSIPTEPNFTEDYNRNQRSLNAANNSASINSPAIANSLRANNLANKLSADNQLAQTSANMRMQAQTNKIASLVQAKQALNQQSNEYKYRYNIENQQDKARRQDIFFAGLNNAASNLNTVRNQQVSIEAMNQIMRYYTFDVNGKLTPKKGITIPLMTQNMAAQYNGYPTK